MTITKVAKPAITTVPVKRAVVTQPITEPRPVLMALTPAQIHGHMAGLYSKVFTLDDKTSALKLNKDAYAALMSEIREAISNMGDNNLPIVRLCATPITDYLQPTLAAIGTCIAEQNSTPIYPHVWSRHYLSLYEFGSHHELPAETNRESTNPYIRAVKIISSLGGLMADTVLDLIKTEQMKARR
jgi:hypothetical protein